jgi:hypothetical protein
MKLLRLALSIVALSLVTSCSSKDSGPHSCNITKPKHTCIEWTPGDSRDEATCSQLGGTFGSTCSRSGSVGGCRKATGSDGSGTEITFYYTDTPATTAAIQKSCTDTGTTYVAP